VKGVQDRRLAPNVEPGGSRGATTHLRHLFPYLPQQSGYNKRLRNLAATISWLIGMLARDTNLWTDDVWVIDSTRGMRPLPRGRAPQRAGPDGPRTATAARLSSATRTISAPSSRLPWPRRAWPCCDQPARANPTLPAPGSSTPLHDHRIDLRYLQRSTQPRRPRRQDLQRHPGPRPATHPRPDHRDLAQRPHRPADQAVTASLRPLTNPLE
jgi:hypothetical protein